MDHSVQRCEKVADSTGGIVNMRTSYRQTETLQYTNFYPCYPQGFTKGFIKGKALRPSNTGNLFLSTFLAILLYCKLWSARITTSITSCGNDMLHKVEIRSTSRNMLTQLATYDCYHLRTQSLRSLWLQACAEGTKTRGREWTVISS